MNVIVKEHKAKIFHWNKSLSVGTAIHKLQIFFKNINNIECYFLNDSGLNSYSINKYNIRISINGIIYYLLPGDYLFYDPLYNNFVVLEKLSTSDFKIVDDF